MPTKLEDVEISKIALVKRPANQLPLLLLKSEDTMPGTKLTLEVADTMIPVLKSVVEPTKDEDNILVDALKADLSDEEKNKVRMALRLLSSLDGKISASVMETLASAAGVEKDGDSVSKEAHEAAVAKARKEEQAKTDREVAKALEKAKTPKRVILKSKDGQEFDVTDESETSRANTEALIKSLDKAHDDNATLRSDARREALLKSARSDFPHLDAERVATVVQKSEDVGDKDATKALTEVLKQAEEIAKAGGLEAERGKRGGTGGGGTAWDKIEEAATTLRKSADGDLTQPQAIEKFLQTDEGAKLYEQYREEQAAN